MRYPARVLAMVGVTSALTGTARAGPPRPLLRWTVDSIKVHASMPKPRIAPGLWTVEAADVATPVVADSLLRWLVLRGFDARVVGRQAPFRVCVGHFLSMRDAMVVAHRLLRPGWTPYVTRTPD